MQLMISLPVLHSKQREIFKSKAQIKIVCAGRQSGKSFVWMYQAVNRMLEGKTGGLYTKAGTDAMLFETFINLDYIKPLIKDTNKTKKQVELKTGGRLTFFSAETPDKIRGNTFDFFVADEVAFTHDFKYAFLDCILPTMTTTQTDVILVSTPNGHDYFYSLFLKGLRKEDNIESFHFTVYDNPFCSAETRKNRRALQTEVGWKQEYLAMPASGENPFGDTQKHVIPLAEGTPVIFGVDLASRVDYTVITGLNENGEVCYHERFKADWNIVPARLKNLPNNIPIIMDSTGVGRPIYDQLQLTRGNIIPFQFTGSSRKQLINKLILDIEQGKIKYTEIYHQEMSTLEGNRLKDGDMKYEAKSGYHDDCVMSLALANYYHEQYKSNQNKGFYKPNRR